MTKDLRIGIDVGGTNTDAVVVDADGNVLASTKAATTLDPFDGIRMALAQVLEGIDKGRIGQAMLGTTHPANAVIQRRGLQRVGALRLAAPASIGVRPGAAWPKDLAQTILGPTQIIRGGNNYDGSEISPLDEDAVRAFAAEASGVVDTIALSAPFSPASRDHELRAEQILFEELGDAVAVSLSHRVGALGLLERENATILNASLLDVARGVVSGFKAALAEQALDVESYITQNDGTLMSEEDAMRLPVLSLGSGPTNSMRGASSLAGLSDAMVIDVGGTSADVGILSDGFPRESASAIEVGGVRTNFRMPDLVSIGLGGGTVVRGSGAGVTVGPDSVGYRVSTDALVRGGTTLTLSDISVSAGRLAGFGDPALIEDLPQEIVEQAVAWVDNQIAIIVERMKASKHQLPLIAVGGGSHLVADRVAGASEVIRPNHHPVANAYGAAISEASGSIDQVYRYSEGGRDACLEQARWAAIDAAVSSGADPASVRVTSIIEVPLTYVPGEACRVQVKAAGPLLR
ncbi:hydantoinase/oxoprolinase family protein [Leucobacter sp. G161]|uniref:hydantoinase/oxoprolinase family protein n=1 Tax=Leucobacter sp. G161 TaxID=663704 RepID=UPI00073D0756|nr:hydantoinase/oxoprolinase family protein [Leucobacter sp. G161]KUF06692.1 hydantoinase subunit beta [Leucobacter sp. G161]